MIIFFDSGDPIYISSDPIWVPKPPLKKPDNTMLNIELNSYLKSVFVSSPICYRTFQGFYYHFLRIILIASLRCNHGWSFNDTDNAKQCYFQVGLFEH